MFQNVVIKISGEALSGKTDSFHNDATIKDLMRQFKELEKNNVKFSLVFGGGNIWRGRENEDIPKGSSHEIGMLASIMNGLYMAQQLKLAGFTPKVMTPFKVGGITELYSREKALDYLEQGFVPIFSAGTGLPFFSTDTITAVRAAEVHADGVIFTKEYRATKPDGSLFSGLYTADPCADENAEKISVMTYDEILEQQLEAIDQAAASILKDEEIPSSVINIEVENALTLAVSPDSKEFISQGTYIKRK